MSYYDIQIREIQGNLVVIRDKKPVMVDDMREQENSIELEFDGEEWIIFESREIAGDEAREYWANMVANDPAEFTCMVGEATLISWALGQYAGPGSTKVKSLEEWLALWHDTPEEHHNSYDGAEYAVGISPQACETLGFASDASPVAYRRN